MSKVTLTVDQIINLGIWEKVCDFKGWDVWIYNEGRIDSNELVTFDDKFEKEVEVLVNKKFKIICPVCNEEGASVYSASIECNNCSFIEQI